jgi:hypothetical protein
MMWQIHQDCTLESRDGIEWFFDKTIRARLHRSFGSVRICRKSDDCLSARIGLRQLRDQHRAIPIWEAHINNGHVGTINSEVPPRAFDTVCAS